jgi:hypothetical protein
MGIGPVSWIEETVDILADDHPWLLIFGTVLIAGLLGLGFYFYFWPIVSGEPEYSVIPVFQVPGIAYKVSVVMPEKIEPGEERQYRFQVDIEQNIVLTTTQQITTTVRPLLPFISVISDSPPDNMATRSFIVNPLTSEPQRFSHSLLIAVSRPASRPSTLPIEVGLTYGNVRYTQAVQLRIDYWSRLVVYLVTSGTLVGFIAFAVRAVKSLIGI